VTLAELLDRSARATPDRVALGGADDGLTYDQLRIRTSATASSLRRMGATGLAFIDVNSDAIPHAVFAAARAGIPFIPLNYRLADDQLRALLVRSSPCIAIADSSLQKQIGDVDGVQFLTRAEFLALGMDSTASIDDEVSEEALAILLFTSGTTGEPKAALLRHSHVSAYVEGTMRPSSAEASEATLVAAPPYHIAGVMGAIAAIHIGRRLVYLPQFESGAWIETVRREGITHAMVVPTMLARILDDLDATDSTLPSLRNLMYGGGRMPPTLLHRALERLPDVDFLNSYGLTETSSGIAILTPKDHRDAFTSADPAVQTRLFSVGRPIRSISLEIRDEAGHPAAVGEVGQIWVRGKQVSGEYVGREAAAADGWLATQDSGRLDEGGYLFVEGRLDDVIIRGAENIAPNAIEDVLLTHPAVADVGVVGLPNEQWGEVIGAAVVLHEGHQADENELQTWVRDRLRSQMTPASIVFRKTLPYSDTGKLLRRVLRSELVDLPESMSTSTHA
jgi:fatty-acyl-CoA synthase